jgi:hypothetical protein
MAWAVFLPRLPRRSVAIGLENGLAAPPHGNITLSLATATTTSFQACPRESSYNSITGVLTSKS